MVHICIRTLSLVVPVKFCESEKVNQFGEQYCTNQFMWI